MFRSRVLVAVLAASALAASMYDRVERVRNATYHSIVLHVQRFAEWIEHFLVQPLRRLVAATRHWLDRTSWPALVSAKAYAARFQRRERPTVFARWRMCPSA